MSDQHKWRQGNVYPTDLPERSHSAHSSPLVVLNKSPFHTVARHFRQGFLTAFSNTKDVICHRSYVQADFQDQGKLTVKVRLGAHFSVSRKHANKHVHQRPSGADAFLPEQRLRLQHEDTCKGSPGQAQAERAGALTHLCASGP